MKQEPRRSSTPRKVPRLLSATLLSAAFLFATAGAGSADTGVTFYTDNAYFGFSKSGMYMSWRGPSHFRHHHHHHHPSRRYYQPHHFRRYSGPGYNEWRPEQNMRRPSYPGRLGFPRNYRR